MASSRDLGRWARPTLMGPFLTCWGIVTMASMTQSLDRFHALFDVDTWALAILLISFFAAAVTVCLVAVDITLLRFKRCALPRGFRGWLGAMLAPISTWIFMAVLPGGDTAVGQALSVAGALWLGALSVRLFGAKP